MKTLNSLMLAALIVLPAVTGCSTNPVTGKNELILISPQQEIAIGNDAAGQFEKEFGGKVADARLQKYVQEVGLAVSAKSDRPMPYEFALLNSDVPNAFALPGGKIYITAGLMRRMENERQLAAVLGHETGHVAARHNIKGLQRQMGAAVLVEIAGTVVSGRGGAAAETVAKVATNIANLRYSRNDEYEADQVGIKYLELAGYNPWGMVELLTVLKNLSDSEPGSLAEFFQTHPITSKRIDEARETIEDDYKSYSHDSPDPRRGQFAEMRAMLR